MRKNLEIERLRALAVLMVVVVHSRFIHPYMPRFFTDSWTGVDLFFVISGYVVTLSFRRLLPDLSPVQDFAERVSMSLVALKVFYWRRVFRILPAAALWMFVYFMLSVYFQGTAKHLFGTPETLVKEIVYFFSGFLNYIKFKGDLAVYHLGHYWSLSVEEHFYLILPWVLIIFATLRSRVSAVLAGIFLVIFILRPFIAPPEGVIPIAFNIFSSHRRFDTLFFGVLLALLQSTAHAKSSPGGSPPDTGRLNWLGLSSSSRPIKEACVRSLPTLVFLALLWSAPSILPNPFKVNMGLTVYGLFSLALVYMATLEKGHIFEFPIIKQFLEYVGSRSYAIYLSHGAFSALQVRLTDAYAGVIPAWVTGSGKGALLMFFLMFSAILIASELTFRLVEGPMMRYGKRFIGERYAWQATKLKT